MQASKTVLIFSHECAPHHRPQSTIGAQRCAQFAKHLPKFGWKTIVLCCDKDQREVPVERAVSCLKQTVQASLDTYERDGSVIIPLPSLKFDGVMDRIWRSLMPGNGRDPLSKRITRKPFTMYKVFRGDYSQSWQPVARCAASAIMEQTQIDVCIGEHSPDAGMYLARWFSRRYQVPWIIDFRDPILISIPRGLRTIYRQYVSKILSTAACTIAVTPIWANQDSKMFGVRSHSIPNGFDPDDFDQSINPQSNTEFTISYMGNITPQQSPEVFFEGLALSISRLTRHGQVRLLFRYRGFNHAVVRRMVESLHLDNYSDIGSHVDRGIAIRHLLQSNLLLLFSSWEGKRSSVYASGCYPGKVFEYFGAKRPIMCVPGDNGILDELIQRSRTGESCKDPEQVADYVSRAYAKWIEGRDMAFDPAVSVTKQFSRCELSRSLANILDDLPRVHLKPSI